MIACGLSYKQYTAGAAVQLFICLIKKSLSRVSNIRRDQNALKPDQQNVPFVYIICLVATLPNILHAHRTMRPQTNKDNISEHDGSNQGRVMKIRSVPIEKSPDIDKAENLHELTSERDEFQESNGYAGELSANNLAMLLRRLSEGSTHEIDNLMDELHNLRNKLQSDGNRIQSDITKYSQLSQGVVQLATIIADNVKNLPAASDIPQFLEK